MLSSGRTPSPGQTLSRSMVFCERKVFLFIELQLFLLLRTSTGLIASNFNCSYCCELQLFLLLRTSTVLIASNFNCSYCCELQLFLLLRTSTVLITANFNCSYCCKLQLFLLRWTRLFLLRRTKMFLFTSLYPVSRVYTTLSTLATLKHRCAY